MFARPSGASARRFMLALLCSALLTLVAMPMTARAGGDWNDTGISWQGYEAGLATAKEQKKPVLLVFYTDWCPHCTRYSAVFHDPKVVEKAKSFVMVRLNKDENPELSKKYAPDGEYIPRTYFLGSAGTADFDLHAPRPQFKYFYDEADPASLLRGMDDALAKLKPSA